MPMTLTTNITNLQEKVIGPARMTLRDDVLAIKSSFDIERGRPGMDDTFNSPKLPSLTASGLVEGIDMVSETLIDSNVAVSATEVGVSVEISKKMLRTVTRDDFLRKVGLIMGSAINVKEEQDFAALIDGFGTVVGTDGASATLGQLGAGLTQLRANTEPVNEMMMRRVSAVISPAMWHDLAQQFFPSGSGEAHSPNTPQLNTGNERVLGNYFPRGDYFGTPVKLSNNLVASGNNIRGGVFFAGSGLIYEFMPVELEVDESDKSMRSIELDMVVDYGQVEILDGFGREWDADNVSPTS